MNWGPILTKVTQSYSVVALGGGGGVEPGGFGEGGQLTPFQLENDGKLQKINTTARFPISSHK